MIENLCIALISLSWTGAAHIHHLPHQEYISVITHSVDTKQHSPQTGYTTSSFSQAWAHVNEQVFLQGSVIPDKLENGSLYSILSDNGDGSWTMEIYDSASRELAYPPIMYFIDDNGELIIFVNGFGPPEMFAAIADMLNQVYQDALSDPLATISKTH